MFKCLGKSKKAKGKDSGAKSDSAPDAKRKDDAKSKKSGKGKDTSSAKATAEQPVEKATEIVTPGDDSAPAEKKRSNRNRTNSVSSKSSRSSKGSRKRSGTVTSEGSRKRSGTVGSNGNPVTPRRRHKKRKPSVSESAVIDSTVETQEAPDKSTSDSANKPATEPKTPPSALIKFIPTLRATGFSQSEGSDIFSPKPMSYYSPGRRPSTRLSADIIVHRRTLARERTSYIQEEMFKMEQRSKEEETKTEAKVEELDNRENDLLDDLKLLEGFDPEDYRTDSSADDLHPTQPTGVHLAVEDEMQLDDIGQHLQGLADDLSVGSEDLDLDAELKPKEESTPAAKPMETKEPKPASETTAEEPKPAAEPKPEETNPAKADSPPSTPKKSPKKSPKSASGEEVPLPPAEDE